MSHADESNNANEDSTTQIDHPERRLSNISIAALISGLNSLVSTIILLVVLFLRDQLLEKLAEPSIDDIFNTATKQPLSFWVAIALGIILTLLVVEIGRRRDKSEDQDVDRKWRGFILPLAIVLVFLFTLSYFELFEMAKSDDDPTAEAKAAAEPPPAPAAPSFQPPQLSDSVLGLSAPGNTISETAHCGTNNPNDECIFTIIDLDSTKPTFHLESVDPTRRWIQVRIEMPLSALNLEQQNPQHITVPIEQLTWCTFGVALSDVDNYNAMDIDDLQSQVSPNKANANCCGDWCPDSMCNGVN